MIGRLAGTVVEVDSSQARLIVDVSGVGYEIEVPNSLIQTVSIDKEIVLRVHTDVRETAINLYGFLEEADKHVFLLLKTVKGVGSKTALAAISQFGAVGVLTAVGKEDVKLVCSIPGVGKKTAERIIVELREKVSEFIPVNSQSLGSQVEVSVLKVPAENDAVSALEKLGFARSQAETVVSEVIEESAGLNDAGEILRQALGKLGGSYG